MNNQVANLNLCTHALKKKNTPLSHPAIDCFAQLWLIPDGKAAKLFPLYSQLFDQASFVLIYSSIQHNHRGETVIRICISNAIDGNAFKMVPIKLPFRVCMSVCECAIICHHERATPIKFEWIRSKFERRVDIGNQRNDRRPMHDTLNGLDFHVYIFGDWHFVAVLFSHRRDDGSLSVSLIIL